jgi:ribosomal protein L36
MTILSLFSQVSRNRARLGLSLALAVSAAPLLGLGAGPAEAAIKCVNGYQIVSGSPIATPYCQDALVADVAQQYGMKVSASQIRNNPNVKRNVCQFVGRDNRVHIACIDANSVGRRGF